MPKDEKKKPRKDSTSDSDSGRDDREPTKKKLKSDSFRTADKEPSWDLSKNRFVKVTEFKGKPYINIREFYNADGELKPGKKGIMLTAEQWQRFKSSIAEIDEEFKKLC